MSKISLLGIEPLMPAYGRDYKTEKELLADFNENKDFKTPSGAYTSKDDLAEMGIQQIRVRFKKLTLQSTITIAP